MEDDFKKVMSKNSDEELIKIINSKPGDYQPKAIEAAIAELKKRGLNTEVSNDSNESKIIDNVEYSTEIKYPTLTMIISILYILGVISLIGTIVYLGKSLTDTETPFFEGISSLVLLLLTTMFYFFLAEIIKLFIDLEYNTRQAWMYLKLSQGKTDKKV